MLRSYPQLERFDHLIVLMMENRSFDNLLGYLYEHDRPSHFIGRGDPEFRGVAGRSDLFNYDNGTPPRAVAVAKAAFDTPFDMCQPCPDPGEFYQPHVNRQVYGQDVIAGNFTSLPSPAPMSGFVQDYIRAIKEQSFWDGVEPTYEKYRVIMDCFPPEAVPVLSGLARNFAVSDEWFASVPSQTFCNRSFAHSAQSRGWLTNSDYIKWALNGAPTVMDRLTDRLGAGRDWRIYYDGREDVSITRMLHWSLRHPRYDDRFRTFDRFAEDCANGDLPAYTFIEPRLFTDHNDMHPPVVPNQEVLSSVLSGEQLVSDVYDAVRHGKNWLKSLLVITFDEHGGCYDHWSPPAAKPPEAFPRHRGQFGFAFDRFGVRVPTIFVSPLIAPGTVVRAAGDVPFDHTSIIKTLTLRWQLDPLTDRDRAAPDFADVLTLTGSEARRETPAMQPRPYEQRSAGQEGESILHAMQKDLLALSAYIKEATTLHEKEPAPAPARRLMSYTDVRDQIRDGDIFLFRGRYFISRMFEKVDVSYYSHAALVAWWGPRLMILQAEGPGVQAIPLSVAIGHYPGRTDWYRLKTESIPDAAERVEEVLQYARAELGIMYGVGPLLRDIIHHFWRFFKVRDPVTPKAMFCSEYVEWCFSHAKLPLSGRESIETFPKDIAASPHIEYVATIIHDPKVPESRIMDSVPTRAKAMATARV